MTFERSTDYGLIRSIITHEKLWPHLSDDFTPAREDWQPLEHPAFEYILARDGGEVLGCFLFVVQSPILREVHTCLLPCAWGKRSTLAASEMRDWVFLHTPCLRIVTTIPAYNRLALRLAKRAGFTEYGRNPQSHQKHGQLYDQFLLGVNKTQCPQQ